MDKRVFIVVTVVLGLIVVMMGITVWALQMQKEQLATLTPTPLPTPTPEVLKKREVTLLPTAEPDTPLAVVDTSVPDQAVDVPLNTRIDITFNKPVNASSFIFAMSPSAAYDISYKQATASVTFADPLTIGETYTYRVNTLNTLPKTYQFTTESDITPDQVEKTYQTDKFVQKQLPYEDESFMVRSFYTEETDLYRFQVTLKSRDKEANRQAFYNWLRGLGLTDEQIANLQINFI